MKVKSVLVLVSLLLFVILFNSCRNSSVDIPGTTTVSGTVRGNWNYPLDNVKITINSNYVITSANGMFSLDNVSLPCDIYVKDSTRKYEIIYKNVNTSSLVLNLPVMLDQNSFVNYSLNVHYPALTPSQKGKIYFIDDEKDILGIQENIEVNTISFNAPPNLVLKGRVLL